MVKLDGPRVDQLLEQGRAESFTPNGRRFREWAAIPHARRRSWARLLDDALRAAAARPTP